MNSTELTMQSTQNSVGLFRVFKPTIVFQAPRFSSFPQFLLKQEYNGNLWNQSLGHVNYNAAPPPSNHVPFENGSLPTSAYNQHMGNYCQPLPTNYYDGNAINQVKSGKDEGSVKEDNTKPDTSLYAVTTTTTTSVTSTSLSSKSRKKKYPCPLCAVRCSNNGQLQGHLRCHTGEKPFVCNYEGCDRRFARNEELTRHKRIHSGFRPHKCDTCQKAFGRKDHLSKHQKTHLQDAEKKVFACTFEGCKQSYSRSDALTRHQSSVHSLSKSIVAKTRVPKKR